MRALIRVIQGDTLAAPPCDCCVRFERIVVLCRRGIGMIDCDCCRCQRGLNIAAGRIGFVEGIDMIRLVEAAAVGAQHDTKWLLLVLNNDRLCPLACNLYSFSDHQSHKLTTIRNRIRLQHREFALLRFEARSILVCEDSNDTRDGLGFTGIERHDPAFCDSALNRERIRHIVKRMLIGISRSASNFLWAIDTVKGLAQDPLLYGAYHRFPSCVRSSSVRTRMLRASGTLNSLPRKGCASASSASAARRKTSSVAAAPRKTDSAFVARHGTWATPPKAMRASRTLPSATSIAAAPETSANAYDARSRTLR